MASIMGRDAPWWSIPAAVAIGVPMYTNAAGIIPIVEALLGKGAALGTVLAFMMSVIALSAPEMIILRKVLEAPADRHLRGRGGHRHPAGGLCFQFRLVIGEKSWTSRYSAPAAPTARPR